jgi:hypothetical protein
MPYPETRCFLIEKVNVEKWTVPATSCDLHDDCYKTREREESMFDIRRTDTGEIIVQQALWLHSLPPGSMYIEDYVMSSNPPHGPDDWASMDAESIESARRSLREHPEYYPEGPSSADPTLPKRSKSYLFASGPQLTVVCPNGGTWDIDSRASNCTMPYDYAHRCWIRHGEPPALTVDKAGVTCQAGAGSIQCGDYHGFLQNGVLTAG